MVIRQDDNRFLMVKDLADGSKAIGLFNRSGNAAEVRADWGELHISGKQSVRDLWHQKELGDYAGSYTTQVPAHGVVMVKIMNPSL
jgi:alpha-galactosidase